MAQGSAIAERQSAEFEGGRGAETALVPAELLRLEELACAGGKLANLCRVAGAGVRTPATAVVPSSLFSGLLAETSASHHLRAPSCEGPAEEELELVRREIGWVSLPAALCADLRAWLERYPATILRSSAANEDGRAFSLAGQLRSYLVRSPRAAEEALRQCWASLFTPTIVEYVRRAGEGAAFVPTLDVLVQEWVEPRVSGVSFTSDVPGRVVTEAIYGHGELLVGGLVSPDRYLYEDGRERERTLNLKLLAAVSHDTSDLFPADLASVFFSRDGEGSACVVEVDERAGVAYVEVPLDAAREACLDTAEVERVSALALTVAQELGFPVDVEWVLARDGRLTLVQARPSTRPLDWSVTAPAGVRAGELLIASGGVCSGVAFVARSAADSAQMPEGHILVAGETTPEYTPALLRACGVVVERGGILSHTAIVCRELGIPCVSDVTDATSRFPTGTRLTVDAVAGEIRVEER